MCPPAWSSPAALQPPARADWISGLEQGVVVPGENDNEPWPQTFENHVQCFLFCLFFFKLKVYRSALTSGCCLTGLCKGIWRSSSPITTSTDSNRKRSPLTPTEFYPLHEWMFGPAKVADDGLTCAHNKLTIHSDGRLSERNKVLELGNNFKGRCCQILRSH